MKLIKALTILLTVILNYFVWFNPPSLLLPKNYSAQSTAEVISFELKSVESEEEIYNFVIEYLNKNDLNFKISNEELTQHNKLEFAKIINIEGTNDKTIKVELKENNLVGISSALAMLDYSESAFIFSSEEINNDYDLVLSKIDKFDCLELSNGVITNKLNCEVDKLNLIGLLQVKTNTTNAIQNICLNIYINKDSQTVLKVMLLSSTLILTAYLVTKGNFQKIKSKEILTFIGSLILTILILVGVLELFSFRKINNEFYFPELLSLPIILLFGLITFIFNSFIRNKSVILLILLVALTVNLIFNSVSYVLFVVIFLGLLTSLLNVFEKDRLKNLQSFLTVTFLFALFFVVTDSVGEIFNLILALNAFLITFITLEKRKANYGLLFLNILSLTILIGTYSLVTMPSSKYPKPTNLTYVSDQNISNWLTILDSAEIFQDEFVSKAINYQTVESQVIQYPYANNKVTVNTNPAPTANLENSVLVKIGEGKYLLKPSSKSIKTILFLETDEIRVGKNLITSENNYFEFINLPRDGIEIELSTQIDKIQVIDNFNYLPTVSNFRPSDIPDNITHSEINGVESGVSYVGNWVEV